MPVGFQSITDSGTIQIDSAFQNYVMTARGTHTLNIWGTNLNYPGAADGSNLLFIHPLNTQSAIYSFGSTSGGFVPGENYYFPKGVFGVITNTDDTNGGQVEYIALANTAAASPPDLGYGFQVFDHNGKISYDATAKYLQIYSVGYYALGTHPIVLPPLPVGKKYFFSVNAITMTMSEVTDYGGSFDEQTYGFTLKKNSDTSFVLEARAQFYNEGGGSPRSSWLENNHRACVMILIA